MGSRKPGRSAKPSLRNPNDSLSSKRPPFKKKKKTETSNASDRKSKKRDKKKPKQSVERPDGGGANEIPHSNDCNSQPLTASEQLKFFVDQYQSANNVQLSSLELESFKGAPVFMGSFLVLGLDFVLHC